MKTAALISGITLLGFSAFSAAQDLSRNSDAAAIDKSSINPVTPGEVKEVPKVPTSVAPSAKPLPTDLITTSASGKELEFLMTALENGRVLAWLGEITKENAQNEQLKSVGGVIAAAQAKENQILLDLAKSKGLNVEAGAPPVQQSKLESELKNGPGPRLDKALIEHLQEATQKAVSVYERGVESKDKELRKTAEQMLPSAKVELQDVGKVAGAL